MSSLSFLAPHASLLSYASPNSTKLRTNPWKPYLLPNPIHGAISSSSVATMSHDSRQNPLTDAQNLDSGSEFDPYTHFYPKTPGNTESDVMRKLLRERMVFLMGKIDASVVDMIIFQLMMLDFEDPTKDIKLFICSTGGLLWPAFTIYDAMQFVKADVSTIALGAVKSPASIILVGGTKGKRLAMPNTRIEPRDAVKLKIQPKTAMHDENNVTTISTFDQGQKDIKQNLSPSESVEYGFIDGIIDRDFIVALMVKAEKAQSKMNYEGMDKNPRKFLTPLFPNADI